MSTETPTLLVNAENKEPWLQPQDMERFPQLTRKRIKTASTMDADITPVAQGIYEVDTGEHSHTVNLDGRENNEPYAACICWDFIYTCAEKNIDCKHILATKRAVNRGVLPPVHDNPESWMGERLTMLYDATMNVKDMAMNTDVIRRCDALLTRIEMIRDTPLEADFEALRDYYRHKIEDATMMSVPEVEF